LKKSDIEKGNNLMLTRLNPSGKTMICSARCEWPL